MARQGNSNFRLSGFAAIVAMVGAAGTASAQLNVQQLKPLDEGVGDIGPLGVSTRLQSVDLRQPTAFERVFRVPGAATGVGMLALRPHEDRYARVDGAITAVFARSDYVETKDGTKPVVPRGTVFIIGDSPLLERPVPTLRGSAPNFASSAVSMQVSTMAFAATEPGAPVGGPADLRTRPGEEFDFREPAYSLRPDAPSPHGPARNIFSDEPYRRARVRQLLNAAANLR